MDYDLDNYPRTAHALRNRISSSGNAGRDLSIQTDAVIIKVDVDNNDVEKYRRPVGIVDLVSEANVARRVSSREAAANQVQIYNANGNQVATTQIDNHILWNTRRRDELTGYYMYKFRHYSAELGRWPARDPIEEKGGGSNLYAFVGNQPTWFWDKLGLNEEVITGYLYNCTAKCTAIQRPNFNEKCTLESLIGVGEEISMWAKSIALA